MSSEAEEVASFTYFKGEPGSTTLKRDAGNVAVAGCMHLEAEYVGITVCMPLNERALCALHGPKAM